MLVDIDKLKRREQQIRDAHDYAAAIVESVPPLLILDHELRVMSANESFYNHFHVSPSQTEHRLVYDLGNGQWDIPALRIFLEETLQRNSSFNDFEVTHEFATIGRRTMLLSGRRVGQLQKILLAIVDVTERKHAAELEALVTERTAALHATVGELEAFSHSIAHDMRAPLRGMQGFAQQLMQEHAGQLDAQGVTYLQRIAASAIRMDKLIQDSLSYTRISRSQVPKEPVDLDKLLRDIVDTYPDWQPPKAEIQIEGTLPIVLGNEAFLTQCISNLLSNAVKFVSPGIIPRVRILAEAIDSQVRLWFEDNGIGIGPEDHERIFRMFARIHPATEYEGTGIGLTIVSKAVERMGGQVGFESELGKGSKFWIQFDKG